jgi:hypothetical protein
MLFYKHTIVYVAVLVIKKISVVARSGGPVTDSLSKNR